MTRTARPNYIRPLVVLLLAPAFALGQVSDLRLPISLVAESTDYDGKNSMVRFHGLRLSQGTTNIEADEGRATEIDFKDAVWQFSGNVTIDVDAGHIESDTAELTFSDTRLRIAEIRGSPATFEFRRPDTDEVTYAQAGKLHYDLDAGIVEFSEDAIITEGGNQISSSFLVYNIEERRINAQSSDDGEDKVKITVIPDAAPAQADESDATEVADDAPDTDTADDVDVAEEAIP